MYKYIPITANLQEMMVMLKSLPAYTLVFDKRCNLVDMNRPAFELLKVNTVQEFNAKRDEVFPTRDYIKIIIHELKKGKTVRYAKTLIRYGDNGVVAVELCACMINGYDDLFLFQLFEISLTTNSNLGSFISYGGNDNPEEDASQSSPWVPNAENVLVVHKKHKQLEERRNMRPIESGSMQLSKIKYRKLTEIEIIVRKLISLNFSLPEIASATNKTSFAIRVIMRRMEEKQRLNS